MGLLTVGRPLTWEEAKKHLDFVREQGIDQLIRIFHRLRYRKGDRLRWGDEIEYVVVRFDEAGHRAQLTLRAADILEAMEHAPKSEDPNDDLVLWHPEFASYMLESTPSRPYEGQLRDLLTVETNMTARRAKVLRFLQPEEAVLSLTCFPRLGCPEFTFPICQPKPDGNVSQSLFFPDEAINRHPRFATLAANIRKRRGKKVAINVPIFKDTHTPSPFVETILYNGPGEGAASALPDHVYLDAMGFGMGCCCLQVTFQACSIEEARHLYDQLAVVSPIVLALSASCPFARGYLTDRDCRWHIISGSVDDRTPAELGQPSDTPSRYVIPKSRYDSISSFIGQSEHFKDEYNDIPLPLDESIKTRLEANGFDPLLARHFAHLFIRDPLVIYEDKLQLDNERSSDHFENIQSTNWQTMRFKPPPPGQEIGWRVEFRPTEVQLTDFENAAFTVFVVLLTRVIVSFNLNFYIPLSKVDENMKNAQLTDAAVKGRFHFRRCISPCMEGDCTSCPYDTMSINEIMNGKDTGFPGLITLIQIYLRTVPIDLETRGKIEKYLLFISMRAAGKLQTAAAWMRNFIMTHPDYKHDSVISEVINYDLLRKIQRFSTGEERCEEMLGKACDC